MIADTKDADLAFHPCVRTVVDKKMSRVGNYFLLLEMTYYLVFLFCMGYSFIAAAEKADPMKYDNTSDIARGIFDCIVIVLWVTLVIAYILGIITNVTWQFHREKGKSENNKTIRLLDESTLKMLSSDVYNIYTLIWIVCLFLVFPLRLASSPVQWIFAAGAVIFGFLRVIKIIRILPGFGTYVHTITLILYYDVPKFILVCLTLVLIMAECFFISLRAPYSSNKPDNISAMELGELGITSGIHWTILSFIRILFEADSILGNNYLSDHLNWLSSIIYMITLMMLMVIIINIFIAQVS